jgi:hypothetical protein
MMRPLSSLALAAVVAAFIIPASASSASSAAAASDTDTVSAVVSTATSGFPLPPDFVGFSYEVPCAFQMFSFQNKTRTSFVNLMNVLRVAAGGTQSRGPNIRIGGNSADQSVYLPAPAPLPTNDTYRITDSDFNAYLAAVPLWKGTITPGVNFRSPSSPALAVAHIQALSSVIPWSSGLVAGIEIGNECDLYQRNGIRPDKGWDMDAYVGDFSNYASGLKDAGVPMPHIQGATFCCFQTSFDEGSPAYMKKFTSPSSNVLSSFSYHNYPLNVCGTNKTANTIYQLLNESTVETYRVKFRPLVDAALALDLPFLIGEGNSVACGGQRGVSDTFASTLWSLDVFFTFAALGMQGFRVHGCPTGAYTAIAYEDSSSDTPTVNPLYYGLWAFASATTNGATIHNVSVTGSPINVKVWPVRDAHGAWRVTVLHKDVARTNNATVTVTLPAGTPVGPSGATLVRLAPASGSAFATKGLSFGGLTFDGSPDGTPQGSPVSEPVQANADGVSFTFAVSPSSVAILTVPAPAA